MINWNSKAAICHCSSFYRYYDLGISATASGHGSFGTRSNWAIPVQTATYVSAYLQCKMGIPAMGSEEAGKAWELKLPKSVSTFPS